MISTFLIIFFTVLIGLFGSWIFFLRFEFEQKLSVSEAKYQLLEHKYLILEAKINGASTVSQNQFIATGKHLLGSDMLLVAISVTTLVLVLLLLFSTNSPVDHSTILSKQITSQTETIVSTVSSHVSNLSNQNLVINQQILDQTNLCLDILSRAEVDVATSLLTDATFLQCQQSMDTIFDITNQIIK